MKKSTLIIISLIVIISSVFTIPAFAGDAELPLIPINPDTDESTTLPEADTDYEVTGVPIVDESTTAAVKRPKKTKIVKLTKGKKRFTVKWKKVKGVKGYQIQYSRKKSFKKKGRKSVFVKKAKVTKKTVKKLKSGKRYYVRVRTYKVVNGKKVYSKWSAKKSVKVR
ncbi:MAG: fibronectin type III domain-containing protein [Eubacterium sp.]|nr:fibronectin type III domain-containing protein [Eubacterium sp.]